jgi:hypothetical protein
MSSSIKEIEAEVASAEVAATDAAQGGSEYSDVVMKIVSIQREKPSIQNYSIMKLGSRLFCINALIPTPYMSSSNIGVPINTARYSGVKLIMFLKIIN